MDKTILLGLYFLAVMAVVAAFGYAIVRDAKKQTKAK